MVNDLVEGGTELRVRCKNLLDELPSVERDLPIFGEFVLVGANASGDL